MPALIGFTKEWLELRGKRSIIQSTKEMRKGSPPPGFAPLSNGQMPIRGQREDQLSSQCSNKNYADLKGKILRALPHLSEAQVTHSLESKCYFCRSSKLTKTRQFSFLQFCVVRLATAN